MNLIRFAKGLDVGAQKTERHKASLYFRDTSDFKNTWTNHVSMLILINKNEIEVACFQMCIL